MALVNVRTSLDYAEQLALASSLRKLPVLSDLCLTRALRNSPVSGIYTGYANDVTAVNVSLDLFYLHIKTNNTGYSG